MSPNTYIPIFLGFVFWFGVYSRFLKPLDKKREFNARLSTAGIATSEGDIKGSSGMTGTVLQNSIRATGPGAGSLKYDILAGLSVAGLAGSPLVMTSMTRLISLLTARYDWNRDELRVGQREMARMWSVNERTVKREIKRLTEARILVCTRPGVRGRVATYRLNMARVLELSEPSWSLIGSDFERRMAERFAAKPVKVVSLSDYVSAKSPPIDTNDLSPWSRVRSRLADADPAVFAAWFDRLEFEAFSGGLLTLRAPSRFVERYIETHLAPHLRSAAEAEFGTIRAVAFA